MELAAPDVFALHDGRELSAVVAGSGNVRGLDALRPEGMDEVDPAQVRQPLDESVGAPREELVPAHVGRADAGGKGADAARHEPQAPAHAMLLAFLEEKLEAEAQTEKAPTALDRGSYGRLETRLEEAVHRRLKGSDAGQDLSLIHISEPTRPY